MSGEILKIHKRSRKESILEQQLSSTDGFLKNFLRTYFGTFASFSIWTQLSENITYLTQHALEVLNLMAVQWRMWPLVEQRWQRQFPFEITKINEITSNNISNKSRRSSVVVNNYPENQHSYGRKFSTSGSKFSKRKKQIVIFSDSIPRGIRLREFNYWLHKGYAQLKSFPGGTSKELLYYVEPTLKNKKFDDALLHVGVNDLLNDESQDSVQNLLDNLKQIGLKCKSAGVKRVLVSGIVLNNKLTSAYFSSVNQRISNMCWDNSFVFIDNNNIPTSSLFRDGLHLLEVE